MYLLCFCGANCAQTAIGTDSDVRMNAKPPPMSLQTVKNPEPARRRRRRSVIQKVRAVHWPTALLRARVLRAMLVARSPIGLDRDALTNAPIYLINLAVTMGIARTIRGPLVKRVGLVVFAILGSKVRSVTQQPPPAKRFTTK